MDVAESAPAAQPSSEVSEAAKIVSEAARFGRAVSTAGSMVGSTDLGLAMPFPLIAALSIAQLGEHFLPKRAQSLRNTFIAVADAAALVFNGLVLDQLTRPSSPGETIVRTFAAVGAA